MTKMGRKWSIFPMRYVSGGTDGGQLPVCYTTDGTEGEPPVYGVADQGQTMFSYLCDTSMTRQTR